MASSQWGGGGGAYQREMKYRCVTPHQTFFYVQNMLFQFGIALKVLFKSPTVLSEVGAKATRKETGTIK